MDLDNLTDDEVKYLILHIKESIDKTIDTINKETSLIGSIKKDIQVLDYENNINYILHIYRGNVDNKYSMHIRFNKNHLHLIRLCINGSNHINSDGTKGGKNHLHVYKIINNQHEDYAYDIMKYNINEFSKDDNLLTSFDKFVKLLNIKE